MLRMTLATTFWPVSQLATIPNPTRAAEGPWCALRNFGSDLSEDCQFRTFEECQQTIVSGSVASATKTRVGWQNRQSSMRRKG